MKLVFSTALVILTAGVLVSASSRCKCLFGQPCWPSASEFSQLALQVSQPLLYPVPPESACYPASNPSSNCADVLQGASDGNWRSNQSGSMQNTNFESYYFPNGTISACYLDVSLGYPCEQGSVPVIGVDARSVGDIQAAVRFAVRHNLRLAVKNTGQASCPFHRSVVAHLLVVTTILGEVQLVVLS
jgi:hypothetical protein